MSAPDGLLAGTPDAPTPSPPPAHADPSDDAVRRAVASGCPYLVAAGGGWRSSRPSRDHRCAAIEPPVQLDAAKQRQLCLVDDHATCATFQAARAARAGAVAPGVDPARLAAIEAARRPVARSAPVVLEQARLPAIVLPVAIDRGVGQLALVGLMVVAAGVLILSRIGGAGEAGASPAAGGAASPSISAGPTVRPTPSPTARPSASASGAPSGSPGVSGGPSASASYRVESGDTLVAIAARFGTTPAAIRELNGMTDSNLRVGQVLLIP